MGVCGCGKSSVGRLLAQRLSLEFIEGDDFHPPANVEKMRNGVPLQDDDRWSWLDALGLELRVDPPVIMSCSALRKKYREFLREKAGRPVIFLCLTGTTSVLLQRLQSRQNHYMPSSLLDSQLAIFEPPAGEDHSLILSIEQLLDDIVNQALHFLKSYEVN